MHMKIFHVHVLICIPLQTHSAAFNVYFLVSHQVINVSVCLQITTACDGEICACMFCIFVVEQRTNSELHCTKCTRFERTATL
jgi:hypothetical protein